MTRPEGEQPRDYPDGVPLAQQPHWNKDFPTDIPEDDYVARREFVKFLVLTSGAFAAGQCWIAAASVARGRGPYPRQQICTVAELESKRVVEFRYPDAEPCLALALAPGRFVAYAQECTHLACAVVPHFEKGELHCPCHNGSFAAADGRPVAGPPRRPLPLVTLDVQNGAVFAVGVERRTV
jgi:Rieske Fe-S protein